MNVLVICDGSNSACEINMRGIAKNSIHNIDVYSWNLQYHFKQKKYDFVYFHYGGILNYYRERKLVQTFLKLKHNNPNVKWAGGILGLANFRWWLNSSTKKFNDFVYEMDAVTVSNKEFYDKVREVDYKIPVYVCRCGVDTKTFRFYSPPKKFCIGNVESMGRRGRKKDCFDNLPFPKKRAFGKIKHCNMPQFYRDISVYVDITEKKGPCGLPFLEVAACGRPIVALKKIGMGVLRYWLSDDEVAYSCDHLVPRIERLRDDKKFYNEQSSRFRRLSLDWDFSIVAKEYDRMFDEVAEERNNAKKREMSCL